MSIVEKIKNLWYRNETDIYESDDFEGLWGIEEPEETRPSRLTDYSIKKSKGLGYSSNIKETNVIENPTLTAQSEVVVIEPRSFDEALDIVEQLRCRRSVVLNLQYLDAEQSQRVVDFLAGATHALDGHQQRVGQGVFIFAPSNFILNSESHETRALKDAFWSRAKEKAQEPEYQFVETSKKSSIF